MASPVATVTVPRGREGRGSFLIGPRALAQLATEAFAVGLTACAAPSPAPSAGGQATVNYMASDCSEIAEELKVLQARMKEFEEGRDPATAACVNSAGLLASGVTGMAAAFTVGAACLTSAPGSPRQAEFERLRAEIRAARDAAVQKRCPRPEP